MSITGGGRQSGKIWPDSETSTPCHQEHSLILASQNPERLCSTAYSQGFGQTPNGPVLPVPSLTSVRVTRTLRVAPGLG